MGTNNDRPLAKLASVAARLTPVLVLVALSVFALTFQWCNPRRMPPDEAWRQAARIVGQGYQKGDVVRIEPYWYTEGRALFEPIVADLEALDIHEDLEPDALEPFNRLWLVVADGFAPPDFGLEPQERHQLAGLTVSRYQLPPDRTLFSFLDNLPTAKVSRRGPKGHTEPCRWSGDKHMCRWQGRWKPYFDVEVTTLDVGGSPRRSVYAHAHPDGGTLTIAYSNVPMGSAIVGHTGFGLDAVRHAKGTPIDLRITVDGRERFFRRIELGDYVWEPFRVDTGNLKGKRAAVAFTIWAARIEQRQLSFDARVIR